MNIAVRQHNITSSKREATCFGKNRLSISRPNYKDEKGSYISQMYG